MSPLCPKVLTLHVCPHFTQMSSLCANVFTVHECPDFAGVFSFCTNILSLKYLNFTKGPHFAQMSPLSTKVLTLQNVQTSHKTNVTILHLCPHFTKCKVRTFGQSLHKNVQGLHKCPQFTKMPPLCRYIFTLHKCLHFP